MMKPELDIRDYIADADYLIQLSDTESYAYSIVEAACLGTPIIATKMPVLDEMNILNQLKVSFFLLIFLAI